ncbi:hypothetical protein PUN28_013195 [Cardiocondyla obscurior]|uniref:Uncharacterized protein n=1 Tax=Cardiocondyla obscurior TaxID=286306 RepID=A0AAW2FAG7_9HYME
MLHFAERHRCTGRSGGCIRGRPRARGISRIPVLGLLLLSDGTCRVILPRRAQVTREHPDTVILLSRNLLNTIARYLSAFLKKENPEKKTQVTDLPICIQRSCKILPVAFLLICNRKMKKLFRRYYI